MKQSFITILCCFRLFFAEAQSAANTWSERFSDTIILRYQPTIDKMTSKGWEYSNSIVLLGMEKVYEQDASKIAYLNYIQSYVDAFVNSAGSIPTSKIMSTLGLDDVHPGLLCLFLYQKTGLAKYKQAAQNIRDTLLIPAIGYPTTPDGGYWHRNDAVNFKNVELLDGIYMAEPFLAKYGAMFNDVAATDMAVNQTILLYNHLFDNTSNLLKHAWDYDKNTYPWAVPATGISTEVWSRGMGWFAMTIVEILRYLPSSYPKYNQLVTMLNSLAVGIKNYQDPGSHLWLDVVDSSVTATKNYIETSGSGMFIYSLKTGIMNGWINSTVYLPVVNSAWAAYKTYIKPYPGTINGITGGPQITSFCPAMGVQTDYIHYVNNQPVNVPAPSGTQHPHGYAAMLMAASAMEFPLALLPVKFSKFYANENNMEVTLYWKNDNDAQIKVFEIQKSDGTGDYGVIGSVSANGKGSYSWTDINYGVSNSNIFYRIKSISMDGSVDFSSVIIIKKKNWLKAKAVISPNPVKNGEFRLSFEYLPAGTYKLIVFNTLGQVAETKKIDYNILNPTQLITLRADIGKGIYFISVIGGGYNLRQKINLN
jgi:unsaturated rhamnogalacturonyl hydrolase